MWQSVLLLFCLEAGPPQACDLVDIDMSLAISIRVEPWAQRRNGNHQPVREVLPWRWKRWKMNRWWIVRRWLSHASLRQLSFETGWHLDWSYHTDWQPVHLPCHANLQSSELSPDAGLRSATLETHKTLDAFYDSTFGTKDWALSFSVGIVLSCYIDCIRRKSVSSWAGLTKLSHQSLLCQALKSVASDSLGEIVGSLQSYVFQGPMQALPIWTGKAQFAWDHGNCLGSQNVGSRAWQSRPPVSVLFWGFIWWQLRIGKSQ